MTLPTTSSSSGRGIDSAAAGETALGNSAGSYLRAFLSWATTSGAAPLARVNFEPLPSSVVTLSVRGSPRSEADT